MPALVDPKLRSSRNPTYVTYRAMLSRCKHAQHYIEQGITVCDRWQESYFHFLDDVGVRPVGMTLDREHNHLGYSKDNCRWRTPTQQARNRTNNVNLTWCGETKTLREWAIDLSISDQTLYSRVRAGWGTEAILSKPPQRVFTGNQWTPKLAALGLAIFFFAYAMHPEAPKASRAYEPLCIDPQVSTSRTSVYYTYCKLVPWWSTKA